MKINWHMKVMRAVCPYHLIQSKAGLQVLHIPENHLLKEPKSANQYSLLLALVLVELQITCKKKLNRKMLERLNICYIFEKLGVQGYQM